MPKFRKKPKNTEKTYALLQSAAHVLAISGMQMSIETAVLWAIRILEEVEEQTEVKELLESQIDQV